MLVADWMQNYQEEAVKQKKSFVLASKDKPEYACCPSTKTVERSNCVVRSHDHLSRSKMHRLY